MVYFILFYFFFLCIFGVNLEVLVLLLNSTLEPKITRYQWSVMARWWDEATNTIYTRVEKSPEMERMQKTGEAAPK